MSTTLEECFDDLATRFLYNLPDEELASFERIFAQIINAWYYYHDHIHKQCNWLPFLSREKFVSEFFDQLPILKPFKSQLPTIMHAFEKYMRQVRVCGAMLLNSSMTQVVVVKHMQCNSGWGLPKGKINQHESDWACAVREVYEETGYRIPSTGTYIADREFIYGHKKLHLFVVTGVPDKFVFIPHSIGEINEVRFVDVQEFLSPHFPIYSQFRQCTSLLKSVIYHARGQFSSPSMSPASATPSDDDMSSDGSAPEDGPPTSDYEQFGASFGMQYAITAEQ